MSKGESGCDGVAIMPTIIEEVGCQGVDARKLEFAEGAEKASEGSDISHLERQLVHLLSGGNQKINALILLIVERELAKRGRRIQ